MTRYVRKLLLAVHFWSGLVLGGWFILLGLSGSALVFYLDLDVALNPEIRVTRTAPARQSVEAIHQALRAAYPQRDGAWRIEMPLAPDMPIMARYQKPVERAQRHFAPLMVTLAPDTLAITSSRFWGDSAMTWLYDLHYQLLLGQTGMTLAGIAGLLMFVMLATGVYLWWPSRARLWNALRIIPRPGAVRRAYDLHVAGGIYTVIVLAVVVLTGSALALPNTTAALLSAVSSTMTPPTTRVAEHDAMRPRLSLDEAVAISLRHFPGAEVRWIETSNAQGAPISLRVYQSSEPSRRFPHTRIWLHPVTGEVLAMHDPQAGQTGDTIKAWLHPLHNGEAYGLLGRSLVCLVGVVPLLLFVTGWQRWRQKARAKRVVESKK